MPPDEYRSTGAPAPAPAKPRHFLTAGAPAPAKRPQNRGFGRGFLIFNFKQILIKYRLFI